MKLYNVGDCIVYGAQGACKVQDIGESGFASDNPDKLYYTLIPIGEKGASIVTPVDSNKITSRPVLTQEELDDLLDEISDLDMVHVQDLKKKDIEYREIIKSADAKSIICLIKTLYAHKIKREGMGKRMTSSDENFLKKALKIICSEMSYIREESYLDSQRVLFSLLEEKVQV